MIRLVACDLDETLLMEDRHVSEQDRKSIRAAREKGIRFVPATGRGFLSAQGTLSELGLLDCPGEYMISFNGCAVSENRGNRLLYRAELPHASVEKLFKAGCARHCCMHIYTLDRVYVTNLNEDERAYLEGRASLKEIRDLDELGGQTVIKMLYQNTDTAYLEQIAENIRDITAGLSVVYSSGRYLEFLPGGISKGSGLRILAEHLQIRREEILAIGDSGNDLPMLQEAGISAAVGNAAPRIARQCTYTCRRDHDHSAVSEALEAFAGI